MAGKKDKTAGTKGGLIARIRKPLPPPTAVHPDRKKKYERKRHDWAEEQATHEPQPAGKVKRKVEPRPGSD